MSVDWIDISVPVYQGMAHWPGDPEFKAHLVKSLQRHDECNVTAFSSSAHVGTHMDAPRHYVAEGVDTEQIPLDAVIGPCRVIEIHDEASIRPSELEHHELAAGERLLLKTRNSNRVWKTDTFIPDFVYISKEAAQFLVDRRVRTVGVDYLSVGGYHKDGTETHQILLGASVWIIEGLNLSNVAPGRYELVCLPVKLRGSDGAPARAILRPL